MEKNKSFQNPRVDPYLAQMQAAKAIRDRKRAEACKKLDPYYEQMQAAKAIRDRKRLQARNHTNNRISKSHLPKGSNSRNGNKPSIPKHCKSYFPIRQATY